MNARSGASCTPRIRPRAGERTSVAPSRRPPAAPRMYRPRTSCSSGSSRRFICERRATSRALSPKSGSFICGCVFANRSPSVAPRRTQAGLIVGQGKQTPAVCASGRWVCIADCRTRSSNGSTSVKPTTLKPATALKEHTCASTRISGVAAILVVNVGDGTALALRLALFAPCWLLAAARITTANKSRYI